MGAADPLARFESPAGDSTHQTATDLQERVYRSTDSRPRQVRAAMDRFAAADLAPVTIAHPKSLLRALR